MATKKTTTKRAAPKWQCDKHPVTGKPCKGRVMSKRDQRLFKVTGKRRKGIGSAKIAEAYGKRPAKKKATRKKVGRKKVARKKITRKAPAKRKTTARKKARKKAPRGGVRVRVPAQAARYVIVDGRNHYVTSARTIATARAKVKAMMTANKRKAFKIIDTK